MQRYLAGRGYRHVVVFCMAGECRNNVGQWPTRETRAAPGTRGFAYFSTKDRAMANEADYGFMLWDGRSRGTLTNTVDMVRRGKSVLVYVAPDKSFYTLQRSDHLARLVQNFDPAALCRIDSELQAATQARRSCSRADTACPL